MTNERRRRSRPTEENDMRTVTTTVALGVTAVVALGLTGCGAPPGVVGGATGSALPVYEDFDAMDAGEREEALVAAAEEEGEVTVYLRADDVFQELEDAFEAEYDVDVTIVNPGRVDVVRQQVLEQAAAGRMEADLVEVFTSDLELVYGEQGIAAPMPEFLAQASADPSLATEFAVETVQYPWVPVWNTDLVTGDNVPTTWEDFLDPFWEDRLVIASGTQDWYFGWFQILTEQEGMSTAEFAELFAGIAANVSVVDSNNPAAAGVASGEYYANPANALVSAQRIGEAAPITWEPAFDKTVITPAGIGLMADAPNPAAAMLFAQWYLEEGLEIVEKEQFVVTHPNETDLAGAELYRADLSGITSEEFQQWRTAYDALVKGGEDILPAYVQD